MRSGPLAVVMVEGREVYLRGRTIGVTRKLFPQVRIRSLPIPVGPPWCPPVSAGFVVCPSWDTGLAHPRIIEVRRLAFLYYCANSVKLFA